MPLTFYLKINLEKTMSSTATQLEPFKHIFKLFDEFRKIFDPSAP